MKDSDQILEAAQLECSYISVTGTYRCRNFRTQALFWPIRIALIGYYHLAMTLPLLVLTAHPCRSLGAWVCAVAIERAPWLTMLHCDELKHIIVLYIYRV